MSDKANVTRVAVIGAGTIGASWAALFLARGLKVTVFDPLPEVRDNVTAYIREAWPALTGLGEVSGPADLRALRFAPSAADAVRDADFVQESGPENMALKAPLLRETDEALPADKVIASSTSGQTITALRTGLAHPERMLVGHPFNPPHLIPLVEVVADEKSAPQALSRAMSFYRNLGRAPIHLTRSVPGHIANRLQAAVWREAIHLAREGVASVADIDTAMATGPGLRWALLGPSATFHLGGGPGGIGAFVDKLGPAFASWWRDLGREGEFTPQDREILVQGLAGLPEWTELRRSRNEKLVELLKLVRKPGRRTTAGRQPDRGAAA